MHKQIKNDGIRNETNRTETVYHVRKEWYYGLWNREKEKRRGAMSMRRE